jgi:glutamyl-tRNA synthetase
MGYLPEAMRNYLARLGWAHGDDELFDDAQAIAWFTLEGIGQSPSRLDFAKLAHVNAYYMRAKPGAELAALLGITSNALDIGAALDSVKSKTSTLIELKDAVQFYLTAPTSYDEKAVGMLAKNGANLPPVITALEALAEPWTADGVKAAINDVATATGKKVGEIMPPMRAAIVGVMSGPDIPDAMAILGKAETLARLKRASI